MTENTQPEQYGRPDDEQIIPFMKIAKPAAITSIILTLASIFFICTKGLKSTVWTLPVVLQQS